MNANSEPISVDLAREPDFSLGSMTARPSLRQVESGGQAETLEPRVMQVLVALAQRKGEVVSRDELIQRCWGGRIVGEDAISRCVARVRKLGEATGAFSLETIARVGYRLLETQPAGPAVDTASELPSSSRDAGAPPPFRRPALWLAAGALAAGVIAIVMLAATPAPTDVETVVARLSDRLRQQAVSDREIVEAGAAVQALGASMRAEERSAYEALASDDSIHAIQVLEDLAAELEARGDSKTAAAVYRKVGAIAVLVDQTRAIAAQVNAFRLEPESLAGFQGIFVTTSLKGPAESIAFANEILKDPELTPEMRGWVLAGRAFAEADWLGDVDSAEGTLAELDSVEGARSSPAVRAAEPWARAVIAIRRNDLAAALRLAREAKELWDAIPERTTNGAEVIEVRVLHALGDWSGAFAAGRAMMERRSRAGDLLPQSVVVMLCDGGLFTGEIQTAKSYCRSAVQRGEGHPSLLKAYSGLAAAADGNHALAGSEFALAHALAPPGSGLIPLRIGSFEAWAALRANEKDRAADLARTVLEDERLSKVRDAAPMVAADMYRLLGEVLIGAGKIGQACAPLDQATQLYRSIGGDVGAEAMQSLRRTIECRAS